MRGAPVTVPDRLAGIDAWTDFFAVVDLPVLKRTYLAVGELHKNVDKVKGGQVTDIVLRDPMMTLKVLQYLQLNRNKRRTADITTIDHALMMLGLEPFFAHFGVLDVMELTLDRDKVGLQGALRVLSRARHAALYARDWARYRHDIEVEEVMVAALLHDLAEMLFWCFAPRIAFDIQARLLRDPALRSRDAQRAVLGFDFLELQLRLAERWSLPGLFLDLMDDQQRSKPRVINVSLAVTLARYSALSWNHPFLPRLYEAIGRFLRVSPPELQDRVNPVTLAAARDWRWYGVLPAAALLPLLPDESGVLLSQATAHLPRVTAGEDGRPHGSGGEGSALPPHGLADFPESVVAVVVPRA